MENNKRRLALNVVFMYIRMFVLLLISLYTSRVLLQNLGVSDFGIYNVVGSIVAMFTALKGMFTSSTQRFLNYEMGLGHVDRLRLIFNMSIKINTILSILFIITLEIVGFFFFHYYINVPIDRLFAAKVVFQLSVLTAVVGLFTTSFDALIVANEKFNFYTYISIMEGFLKLLVIYLLIISSLDNLILYASLILGVTTFILLVNFLYCRRKFEECRFIKSWDNTLFRDMLQFSGWQFLGNMGYSLSNEGLNMMLNVFGATILNAARGIAYQVISALQLFLSNITKALDPYSTKIYAQENFDTYYRVVFFSSKTLFTFCLCITVPFYFYAHKILQLWLGVVPDYSVIFTQILMVYSLIRSLKSPLFNAFTSANKMKVYQLTSIGVSMLTILCSFICLKADMPFYSVFLVMCFSELISLCLYIFYVKIYCGMNISCYMKCVVCPILLLSVVGFSIGFVSHMFHEPMWILSIFLTDMVILIFSYFIGFTPVERGYVMSLIRRK